MARFGESGQKSKRTVNRGQLLLPYLSNKVAMSRLKFAFTLLEAAG